MKKKAKKWIQGAIKHPGAFSAKAEKAGKSTAAFANEHEHDSGKLGKQARLAKTLMGMHHKKHSAPTGSSMRKKMYGTKGE